MINMKTIETNTRGCPSKRCEHMVVISKCQICYLCKHGKFIPRCIECGITCIHKKFKNCCIVCSACIHGMVKKNCRICRQRGFCRHGQKKIECSICINDKIQRSIQSKSKKAERGVEYRKTVKLIRTSANKFANDSLVDDDTSRGNMHQGMRLGGTSAITGGLMTSGNVPTPTSHLGAMLSCALMSTQPTQPACSSMEYYNSIASTSVPLVSGQSSLELTDNGDNHIPVPVSVLDSNLEHTDFIGVPIQAPYQADRIMDDKTRENLPSYLSQCYSHNSFAVGGSMQNLPRMPPIIPQTGLGDSIYNLSVIPPTMPYIVLGGSIQDLPVMPPILSSTESTDTDQSVNNGMDSNQFIISRQLSEHPTSQQIAGVGSFSNAISTSNMEKLGSRVEFTAEFTAGFTAGFTAEPNCVACIHCGNKQLCRICNGCHGGHGLLVGYCKTCDGCHHKRLQITCTKCNKCVHGRDKYLCRVCQQKGFCSHGRLAVGCDKCELIQVEFLARKQANFEVDCFLKSYPKFVPKPVSSSYSSSISSQFSSQFSTSVALMHTHGISAASVVLGAAVCPVDTSSGISNNTGLLLPPVIPSLMEVQMLSVASDPCVVPVQNQIQTLDKVSNVTQRQKKQATQRRVKNQPPTQETQRLTGQGVTGPLVEHTWCQIKPSAKEPQHPTQFVTQNQIQDTLIPTQDVLQNVTQNQIQDTLIPTQDISLSNQQSQCQSSAAIIQRSFIDTLCSVVADADIFCCCEHCENKLYCRICNDCGHGSLRENCFKCSACRHGRINCHFCCICIHGGRKKGCETCGQKGFCEHGVETIRCVRCAKSLRDFHVKKRIMKQVEAYVKKPATGEIKVAALTRPNKRNPIRRVIDTTSANGKELISIPMAAMIRLNKMIFTQAPESLETVDLTPGLTLESSLDADNVSAMRNPIDKAVVTSSLESSANGKELVSVPANSESVEYSSAEKSARDQASTVFKTIGASNKALGGTPGKRKLRDSDSAKSAKKSRMAEEDEWSPEDVYTSCESDLESEPDSGEPLSCYNSRKEKLVLANGSKPSSELNPDTNVDHQRTSAVCGTCGSKLDLTSKVKTFTEREDGALFCWRCSAWL